MIKGQTQYTYMLGLITLFERDREKMLNSDKPEDQKAIFIAAIDSQLADFRAEVSEWETRDATKSFSERIGEEPLRKSA